MKQNAFKYHKSKYLAVLFIIITVIVLIPIYFIPRIIVKKVDSEKTTEKSFIFSNFGKEMPQNQELGLNVVFNYPEDWVISIAGKNSGVFVNKSSTVNIISDYKIKDRNSIVSISIVKTDTKTPAGYQNTNPYLVGEYNSYDVENDTTYNLEYSWQKEDITDFYFKGRCIGSIDDSENIKDICVKIIRSFSAS